MLPSTGYFNSINCPFYDSGLCERPYCHFRHVKKDLQTTSGEDIESETFRQLVSEAVKKVLQRADASTPLQVVSSESATSSDVKVTSFNSKATYNPTPIAELNKINNTDTENVEDLNEQRRRHIPVPYTPLKPVTASIKRPTDTNGSTKPFIYIPPTNYVPGSTDNVKPDPYLPKGNVVSTDKYLPGKGKELQPYTPTESNVPSKLNYIPSEKPKKNLLEYTPCKVTTVSDVPKVTYQPTPLSLVPCFSSDEEGPVTKKQKVSDINNLDDLETEFEILDQILDEEKCKAIINKDSSISLLKNKTEGDKVISSKKSSKSKSEDRKHKSTSEKSKSSTREESANSSSRSRNKSSHKDKYKDRDKQKPSEKESSDKKKSYSRSRSSEKRHSKSVESNSTVGSDKDSKHSSKSKRHSKDRDTKRDKHRSSKERHHSKEKLNTSTSNSATEDKTVDVEVLSDISDADEESIALECKKIFEEYVPVEKNEVEIPEHEVDNDNDEYISSKKRISRTADHNAKILPRAPLKPDFKVNAAHTMAERLAKVREFHAAKQSLPPVKLPIPIPSRTEVIRTGNVPSGNNKIRIAHVPYAAYMVNSKKEISAQPILTKTDPPLSSTIVQTIQKGTQRVAHIPNEKFIDRPGVLEPLASKIPANIRSTYLNMMIDECVKIYLSPTDAYARAQHEELTTSKKCTSVQIYKNSAVLTVSRLRKEIKECNGTKKSGADCCTLQNIISTKVATTSSVQSWSIQSRKPVNTSQEFVGAKFYANIRKWILTEEQLQENGFPRPHTCNEKGRAKIYIEQKNKQKPPRGFIRTCTRCKKDYTVDKKGFPAFKEECVYHPNNKYKVRGEARYQCCSQDGGSDGCCVAPNHVYEYVDHDNLKGYVTTLPPEGASDDYGVYALDCEMCYTTQGLDLTRVTVINSSCKVVYETLIRPMHPILDYNTRFSGITAEQMASVKTTLIEVQATLLSMFNSKTILIGHSLESDFKALKLIHDTVVDTSVLFPHKMGPPMKRALRNLTSEYLKKIIQNSVDGHDSAEDATVCMELIQFKLKEFLKTR